MKRGCDMSSKKIKINRIVSLLCFGVAAATVHAADIYTWISSDGVTHYSQTRPVADQEGMQKLHMPELVPVSASSTSYRSTLALADKLQRSRLQRERLRLEKKKLLQQRNSRQQAVVSTPYYQNSLPVQVVYSPGLYHRDNRHHRPTAKMRRHVPEKKFVHEFTLAVKPVDRLLKRPR